MSKTTTLLFTLMLLITAAYAQPAKTKLPQPFILGQVQELYSNELKENRKLNIYLPEGYSPDSATTYPVIYLLDASANEDFIHIVGIVQFLTMIDAMPKTIVAGIANVDRKRDFTFPTNRPDYKKELPTHGGSAAFMAFIEKEIQPFIQKNYKTNGVKTIIGQSLGGLLVTEILLKKPRLFNNYIIVSPSLWWDEESLLHAAPQLLQKQADDPLTVFVAVGTEGPLMEPPAKSLDSTLSAAGKKQLHNTLLLFPAESHRTILHNCVYKSLSMLYKKETK